MVDGQLRHIGTAECAAVDARIVNQAAQKRHEASAGLVGTDGHAVHTGDGAEERRGGRTARAVSHALQHAVDVELVAARAHGDSHVVPGVVVHHGCAGDVQRAYVVLVDLETQSAAQHAQHGVAVGVGDVAERKDGTLGVGGFDPRRDAALRQRGEGGPVRRQIDEVVYTVQKQFAGSDLNRDWRGVDERAIGQRAVVASAAAVGGIGVKRPAALQTVGDVEQAGPALQTGVIGCDRGFDRAGAVFQQPVATERGIAGGVNAGGHVGIGQLRQRIDELIAHRALRHVAAVEQDVGLGGEAAAPLLKCRGVLVQRLRVDHRAAQTQAARVAVRNDVNGADVAFARQHLGDLRQAVALGIELDDFELRGRCGGAEPSSNQSVDQALRISHCGINKNQFVTGCLGGDPFNAVRRRTRALHANLGAGCPGRPHQGVQVGRVQNTRLARFGHRAARKLGGARSGT